MNKQFFIFYRWLGHRQPRPCRLAAIVIHGTRRQEIAGSVPWATISEMELRAAVEALSLTPVGARIEMRSDSELLINGMRYRVFRWRRSVGVTAAASSCNTRDCGANCSSLTGSEQFAGSGLEDTAAIPFSPVLIFSLIRRHAIKIVTYQWRPDRRAINLKKPNLYPLWRNPMTDGNTLFEIDRELDSMLDQIEEEAEENGTASPSCSIDSGSSARPNAKRWTESAAS